MGSQSFDLNLLKLKRFTHHEAHEEPEGINQKHKKCYQLEYSILPSREGRRGVFFMIWFP